LQVVAEGSRAAPEPSAEGAGLRAALLARYRTLCRHSLMSVPPPPIGAGGDAPIRGYTGYAGGGGGEAAAAGGAGGGESGSVWRRQQRAVAGAAAAADVDGPAEMSPAEEEVAIGMAEAAAEAVALLSRAAPPPRARRLFRRVAIAPAEAEGAPPPHVLLAREWRAHARAAPPPLGALAARAAAQAEAEAVAAVAAPPPPRGTARYRLARRWESEGVEVAELRPEFNTDVVHARHLEMLRAELGDEMVDSDIAELLGAAHGPQVDAEGVKAEAPPPQRPWAIYVEVRAVAVRAACVRRACRVRAVSGRSPTPCYCPHYY